MFDFFVDILFGIDILVNFISSYENPETGLIVVNLKDIARNYISGWFTFDIFATMPLQLLEDVFSNGSQFKLARLARLPRLYRLIRIVRMIKLLRIVRKSHIIKELAEQFSSFHGLNSLIRIFISTLFLVHLMACVWFINAAFASNMHDTWVGQRLDGIRG